MDSSINNNLGIIEEALQWTNVWLAGSERISMYDNLVRYRRSLKKIKYSLHSKPAAAVYGESQVGKSYLIGSLLSKKGSRFCIADGKNLYDFISDINPQGGGSESTSLVSRFSADSKPVDSAYPITAKLLSPADLVLVICDTYFNDIRSSHDVVLTTVAINQFVHSIEAQRPQNAYAQNYITEDDLWNIKDYLMEHCSNKTGNVLNSQFFAEVSQIIKFIPPADWINIFEILWNRNSHLSGLFRFLISEYERIGFSESLFLPIESVLAANNTILDVKCLYDIGKLHSQKVNSTRVCYFAEGKKFELDAFSKASVCALAAEVVFCLPEDLHEEKPFLEGIDLLDLPGIRARLTLPEDEIDDSQIPNLLIRAKVSYLFNKYVEAERINILLLCAKHEQPGPRAIPELLKNWINKAVGNSPEAREEMLKSVSYPPLFIVSTFFNMSLAFDSNHDKPGNDRSLKYRWDQRFKDTLSTQIINSDIYDWFRNWTVSETAFQNIFLLRDFSFSESRSSLFKGYNQYGIEKEEVFPEGYPNFRSDLKQAFLSHDFVRRHFSDPEQAWDRAASMNEDGTSLIIERLTLVGAQISKARLEKAVRELNASRQDMHAQLAKFYHDSDKDRQLESAKSEAGNIRFSLDLAFGRDPYFFGKMMKVMMVEKSKVYSLFLDKIRDIERREVVNMDKYSAIRMHVRELNENDPFEVNLERLRIHYQKETLEECRKLFVEQGVDLEELFYGNKERVRAFSMVLSEAVEEFWTTQCMEDDRKQLQGILGEEALMSIQQMLIKLFSKLNLKMLINERIRRYVDGYRNIEDVYEMIADLTTEIINRFINEVGFTYFSRVELEELNDANERNALGLKLEHSELEFKVRTAGEAAELLDRMTHLPELLNQNPLPVDSIKGLPNYRNYMIWYDRLKVGYIFVCNIPKYNQNANKKLAGILEQCLAIKY